MNGNAELKYLKLFVNNYYTKALINLSIIKCDIKQHWLTCKMLHLEETAWNLCRNFPSKSFHIDHGVIKLILPLQGGQLPKKSHFLKYIKEPKEWEKQWHLSIHSLKQQLFITCYLTSSVLDSRYKNEWDIKSLSQNLCIKCNATLLMEDVWSLLQA